MSNLNKIVTYKHGSFCVASVANKSQQGWEVQQGQEVQQGKEVEQGKEVQQGQEVLSGQEVHKVEFKSWNLDIPTLFLFPAE